MGLGPVLQCEAAVGASTTVRGKGGQPGRHCAQKKERKENKLEVCAATKEKKGGKGGGVTPCYCCVPQDMVGQLSAVEPTGRQAGGCSALMAEERNVHVSTACRTTRTHLGPSMLDLHASTGSSKPMCGLTMQPAPPTHLASCAVIVTRSN